MFRKGLDIFEIVILVGAIAGLGVGYWVLGVGCYYGVKVGRLCPEANLKRAADAFFVLLRTYGTPMNFKPDSTNM